MLSLLRRWWAFQPAPWSQRIEGLAKLIEKPKPSKVVYLNLVHVRGERRKTRVA